MSDFSSLQPDSDIHICGLCRAEFNNIYDFIEHKKHCTINQTDILTTRHASKFVAHHDDSHCTDQTPHDSSVQVVGNVVLPAVENNHASSGIQYGHLIQPDLCSDRQGQQSNEPKLDNISFVYPSSTMTIPTQQQNILHLTNLGYDNNAPPENNMAQYKTSVSSSLIQSDPSNHEHNFPSGFFEINNSPSQPESAFTSSLDNNSLPTPPHNPINCSNKGVCITDNSADSSALCPEDLEVGQISEAMIGKLSQKFCPKGQSKHRKIDSGENFGKLDPISTFTVKGKKNEMLNDEQVNLNVKKLFPVSNSRINCSSVPLAEMNKAEQTDSCVRGISFEKRERLQGVSDELLEALPLNSRAHCENDGSSIEFDRTLSQNIITENPAHLEETHVENPSKKSSLYKAVFTSPSSGGHRLSVKISEANKISSTQYYCDVSPREFTEKSVQAGFERNSSSTSYRNISKLAEMSQNGTPENDCSVIIQNYSIDHGSAGSQLLVNPNSSYTVYRERNMNDCMPFSQQIAGCPATNLSGEDVSHYVQESDHHVKTGFGRADGNKILDAKSAHNPTVTMTSQTLAPNTKHLSDASVSLDVADQTPWSATDVTGNYTNNNVVGKEVSGLTSNSDREEMVVIVYKREDNSVIMMYKPKQSIGDEHFVCQRNDEEVCPEEKYLSQQAVESLNKEGQVEEQEYQLHSVVERNGEYFLSNLGHNQGQVINESGDQQVFNLYSLEEKPVEFEGFGANVKRNSNMSLPDRDLRTHDTDQNVVYVQSPGKKMTQRHLEANAVNSSNNMKSDRDRHVRVERTLKEPPLRAKQKNMKGQDSTIASNHSCSVNDSEKEAKSRTKSFTCQFGNCSYSTSLYKDFQRHYRTHTGERPYRCEECGKTFNRSDKLKTHLRCHAGQKPFKCKVCSYATVDSGSLKKHMRIHTDERPFQCQICPYASRNSSQLIVHLRTHTGDAPFHCSVCSAQFKIKSDLKRHLRVHTGEKPFECDKCDYRSSNKGNLKTHYKINHSLENEKSCPQCSFATSSMKRLREHIKIHDEARIVKCRVCQYTCNSSTALRSHMMVHNSLRPFRCSFCPYSSKQSGNLKKHIQSVHQEKHRMVVTIGSKYASDKSQGRKRNKSHENETDYRPIRRSTSSRKIHTCHMCGSGFVRQDSLRCHLKQHREKESVSTEGTQLVALPKDPHQDHSSTKSPPPPLLYRRQGLDHIVAAASQLYREQYMNGEKDSESPNLVNTESSSRLEESSGSPNLHNDEVLGTVQRSNNEIDQREYSQNFPSPRTEHLATSTKKQQTCFEEAIRTRQVERAEHSLPTTGSHLEKHEQHSQIPWEHACYTVSNKSRQHRTDTSSRYKRQSPSSISKASIPSSPPQSSKFQTMMKSPSQKRHHHQSSKSSKSISSHSSENIIQPVPSEVTRLEPQTVNIQMTSINSASSQLAVTPQNMLGPVSYSSLPSDQTAFQILLPSGTPLIPVQAGVSQMGQATVQPQRIMFQIQGTTPARPDVVTIPTSMATTGSLSVDAGSQMVLGQCPAYGLVQIKSSLLQPTQQL